MFDFRLDGKSFVVCFSEDFRLLWVLKEPFLLGILSSFLMTNYCDYIVSSNCFGSLPQRNCVFSFRQSFLFVLQIQRFSSSHRYSTNNLETRVFSFQTKNLLLRKLKYGNQNILGKLVASCKSWSFSSECFCYFRRIPVECPKASEERSWIFPETIREV